MTLSRILLLFALICGFTKPVSAQDADAVRIVDGPSEREGRLEVLYKSSWGTVCADGFTDTSARVACHMLGYGYDGKFTGRATTPGTGDIWLDEVACSGTETNIGACPHNAWGVHDCTHNDDVSIRCGPPVTVRLLGGSSSNEGRLEVYYNMSWGTVCRDGFTDSAAAVACNMLGYGYHGTVLTTNYPSTGVVFWLDEVNCTGTEMDIASCQHNGWGVHDCDHTIEDVFIKCDPMTTVRLVGGPSPQEGRLELLFSGVWGTVCVNGFTDASANVVCYMLGYGYDGVSLGAISPGNGTIWLDEVACRGKETEIALCPHSAWEPTTCTHADDVSLRCGEPVAVRLFGGSSPQDGRVEVYYNSTWGTVCSDRFTDESARVVCNMLGFGYIGYVVGSNPGNGTIWLDEVSCNGTEMSIAMCPRNAWGVHDCDHTKDVFINCTGPVTTEMPNVTANATTPSPVTMSATPSATDLTTASPMTPGTGTTLSSETTTAGTTVTTTAGPGFELSTGIIIGIVVGGFALVAMTAGAILAVRTTRRRRFRQPRYADDDDYYVYAKGSNCPECQKSAKMPSSPPSKLSSSSPPKTCNSSHCYTRHNNNKNIYSWHRSSFPAGGYKQ